MSTLVTKEKRNTILKVGELLDTIQHVAETALDAGVITRNDILKVKLKKNELASLSLKLENGIALASHLLCQQIGIGALGFRGDCSWSPILPGSS